jgi:hypothetical protein
MELIINIKKALLNDGGIHRREMVSFDTVQNIPCTIFQVRILVLLYMVLELQLSFDEISHEAI